ncbi:hypothetical protein BDV96DRAFT_510824 [Lophiotrema nucula]|uniref:Uncharacterized protein n=1 Tax=Lophiotrema nucula TaxID=690887 RepID=A0A6A5ZW24_9PLEO|nr:hypothetical protein BDV96DRAFT_510824 [Lophiotrema nucula]
MKTSTQFIALRPDPEDDARTSYEMLNMRPHSYDDEPRKWDSTPSEYSREQKNRKWSIATLREKLNPFPWRTFLIICLLPIALAPIIVLSTAAEEASVGYIQGRQCYPNGMWAEVSGATWRIMDSSYFFTPNLSFGSMSFTAVKIIDITWDLLVGRGGQMLLAWVNYRVFNEWLMYHMECHLTSYKMYTAVAFQTTTMSTLGVLLKEFLAYGEKSWKRFFRWLAMLCMVLSTLYVLSFPTLMAAMTGYITTYEAYIEDFDKNLIEVDKFGWVLYVIEDAHRIGDYDKPLVARRDDRDLVDTISDYIDAYEFKNATNPGLEMGSPYAPLLKTNLMENFSRNISTNFTFGGKTTNLESPTLNISLYAWYMNMETPKKDSKFERMGWAIDESSVEDGRQGDVYLSDYILKHGSCKPSETYQWGFSYIFLFMISIFNFVWGCIMVGMWLDTSTSSRMYKSGRRPGLLRSIMDICEAIREEIGEGVDRMEEEDLRRRLRDGGSALVVPKKELRVARTRTGDEQVRRRGRWKSMTKGSTF